MRALASRDKVDVDTFHKSIQYALESRNLALKEQQYQILKAKDTRALGTSLLITPELRVLVLTKRHVGSKNEIELNGNICFELFLSNLDEKRISAGYERQKNEKRNKLI